MGQLQPRPRGESLMSVILASPKSDYTGLDGEFDEVVAAENGAEYRLTCEECGETQTGTSFELADDDWEWTLSIDRESLHIVDSKAVCGECNGELSSQDSEDLDAWKKAAQDERQTSLGDI
jgi:hypothetical protein